MVVPEFEQIDAELAQLIEAIDTTNFRHLGDQKFQRLLVDDKGEEQHWVHLEYDVVVGSSIDVEDDEDPKISVSVIFTAHSPNDLQTRSRYLAQRAAYAVLEALRHSQRVCIFSKTVTVNPLVGTEFKRVEILATAHLE